MPCHEHIIMRLQDVRARDARYRTATENETIMITWQKIHFHCRMAISGMVSFPAKYMLQCIIFSYCLRYRSCACARGFKFSSIRHVLAASTCTSCALGKNRAKSPAIQRAVAMAAASDIVSWWCGGNLRSSPPNRRAAQWCGNIGRRVGCSIGRIGSQAGISPPPHAGTGNCQSLASLGYDGPGGIWA